MRASLLALAIILGATRALVNEAEFAEALKENNVYSFSHKEDKLCTFIGQESNINSEFLLSVREAETKHLSSWIEASKFASATEEVRNARIIALKELKLDYLGVGGSSIIFAGKDGEKDVVVKALYNRSGLDKKNRMELFFWVKAQFLNKESVPELFECAMTDDLFFFIQEKFDSDLETFAKDYIRGNHFTESIALSIVIQMAERLQDVHSMEVNHNDIKLDNFLVSTKPDSNVELESKFEPKVKIMDFGGANINGKSIVGATPEYKSPEMFYTKKGSFPSDVYSLGLAFFSIYEPNFAEIFEENGCYLRQFEDLMDEEEVGELFANCVFFMQEKVVETFKTQITTNENSNPKSFAYYSDLSELIKKMISYDMDKRPKLIKVIEDLKKLKENLGGGRRMIV